MNESDTIPKKEVIRLLQKQLDSTRLHENLTYRHLASFEEDIKNWVDEVPELDIEGSYWDEIKQAASTSNWIPKEYFMNDWVSDICDFLKFEPNN